MDLDAFIAEPSNLTAGRTYLDVVAGARQIIADHDRWCQHAMAVDAYGRSVKPCDPTAVRWSMMGAIARNSNVLGIISPELLSYVSTYLTYRFSDRYDCAGDFNDYVAHSAVLQFMDEMISNWNR
jgi:hypothetical protein